MRARRWSSRRTANAWPVRRRDVVVVAGEVADHLVDAVDADRREVVAQRAEVALGVREEPLVDQPLDHLALHLEAVLRVAEQLVEALVEADLVAGVEVAQPRAVDRHHADRAGLLGGAEEPVAALQQLAQVELQPAAHRPDHVRLQLGVEEVLEVRQPVLRRHREQRLAVRVVPVEVRRDVVGRDREREHAALGVARRSSPRCRRG